MNLRLGPAIKGLPGRLVLWGKWLEGSWGTKAQLLGWLLAEPGDPSVDTGVQALSCTCRRPMVCWAPGQGQVLGDAEDPCSLPGFPGGSPSPSSWGRPQRLASAWYPFFLSLCPPGVGWGLGLEVVGLVPLLGQLGATANAVTWASWLVGILLRSPAPAGCTEPSPRP